MSYLEDTSQKLDTVRPGEQWFLYWKTSASLWESRITQFPAHQIIFIPINWGFHAEMASTWDFGKYHPEKDLGRLAQLLTHHGRKFCWILPLTPAPFLPNGGVPVSAAKTLSISRDGIHLAALDHENKLNKMFSYFEPKVFQTFVHFATALKDFFQEVKIKAPIWGANFCYTEGKESISYFEDYSFAFEQGFSRYLKQNSPQGVDLTQTSEEEKLKEIFSESGFELFKSTAAETFASQWMGVQTISVLGSSPRDTIERALTGGKPQAKFFEDLFQLYVNERWVSSCLLTMDEKKDLLPKVLQEHFGSEAIAHRYKYQSYGGELDEAFRPFSLMDIIDSDNSYFTQVGLIPYLDKHYRWMYNLQCNIDFTTEWIESHHQRVKFFSGKHLDRTRFGQMLKLFMMGQKVVLDKNGLSVELERRLQVFFHENNLKLQTINYVSMINICELGEGRLVTYEGDKLLNHENTYKFWNHLFKYFSLNQPELTLDQDVFILWRIRATSPYELNYLDVRRINLYNPTSYKKTVTIKTQQHFAFMKLIDPEHAQAKSNPHGVDVELLPNGKIALDFGHYEETK